MKHVALITLHADPATPSGAAGGGGTHAYVREVMVRFAGVESRLTVLTRWADPELPEQDSVSSNIRLVRLRVGPVAPLDKREIAKLHVVSVAAANAALLGSGVDLIHSVYWDSGRVALELSPVLRCSFVHTVISNGWRRLAEGALDQPLDRIEIERQVFLAAFAIFCISGEERRDLIEHYGVDQRKIVVVGRPVHPAFQEPCRDEWGRPAALRYLD